MAAEERVAIVTGAGSGIGQAAATRLAGLGIAVVAVGRRPEALVAGRQRYRQFWRPGRGHPR